MSMRRLSLTKLRLSFVTYNETQYVIRGNIRCGSTYSGEEYVKSPEYPPILDLSPEEVYKRSRDEKLNKIKQLGTVEEKLIGINMPRYYGWNSLILKEGDYPFNFMPFVQHITRTDFIQVNKLPFSHNLSKNDLENIIQKIRPQLQDAVLMEMLKKRSLYEFDGTLEKMGDRELNDEITKGVVEQINRVLCANLAPLAPHLYQAEVDFEPRIEGFWRVHGFYPDDETYKKRKQDKRDYEKELKRNRYAKRTNENEPEDLVGHFIQYLGTPMLQLRHTWPLRPLEVEMEVKDQESVASRAPNLKMVPVVRYDPGFYGLEKIRRHGTNIPGYWPGDCSEFGLLSFHSRGHLLGRPPTFGEEDIDHTVTSQAILAGYAWLLAQANYQGFSTFHDITYPLATTTVVTDGRVFSFFASQLNTLLFHDEFIETNPKVNVCYGLPSCELYQKIEGNEFVDWNDSVLALLVEAYLNAPQAREGVDLKPYLDKDIPLVKDIAHEERRIWLHRRFRHLFSNRPRHRLGPEIYDWEYIYKIKFEMRHMDARRRFFELGIDPFKRRLDDHYSEYIPKKYRDNEKRKQRFKDMYYPDC